MAMMIASSTVCRGAAFGSQVAIPRLWPLLVILACFHMSCGGERFRRPERHCQSILLVRRQLRQALCRHIADTVFFTDLSFQIIDLSAAYVCTEDKQGVICHRRTQNRLLEWKSKWPSCVKAEPVDLHGGCRLLGGHATFQADHRQQQLSPTTRQPVLHEGMSCSKRPQDSWPAFS